MQGIAAIVEAWITQRRTGAIARVIGADGLGPRSVAGMLLVDANGRTGGSLLAGAAQPEVITAARRLLGGTAPHLVVSLDVGTVDATAAGLTCGGRVDVLVQRIDVIPRRLWDTLAAGRPAALVTVLGAQGLPMVVQPVGDGGFDRRRGDRRALRTAWQCGRQRHRADQRMSGAKVRRWWR